MIRGSCLSGTRGFGAFWGWVAVLLVLTSPAQGASIVEIIDLGSLGDSYSNSEARAITSVGPIAVAGWSYSTPGYHHAFLWDEADGMQDLGTLGGIWSEAHGINNSRQVVGWSYDASGYQHAFLWDEETGMQDLHDLVTLGGTGSVACGINDSGQVVGSSGTASGYSHAFLWDEETGMQDLGTLGGTQSQANAINDSGQVVGGSYTASGYVHAFLWDPVNGMQDLGTLGGSYSGAYGISDSGQVVGQSLTASGYAPAFLWDSVNGMQDLGTLGGSTTSLAYGINDSGQVVGYSFTALGTYHAFLWDSASGMKDLGTLSATDSRAFGVNNLGQAVGWSYTASGYQHAFLWDSVNGMQDLGTLGGTHGWAFGINDSGQVVGFSTTVSGSWHAFLWDEGSGMQDLGTLGGTHSSAEGINDSGQVVGWSSTPSGYTHAFLWDAETGMQDLGTLGGTYHSSAYDINDSGRVVGTSSGSEYQYAFLWDEGTGMQDIGTLGGPVSWAQAVNSLSQVVGVSWVYYEFERQDHGFLWDSVNGMQDLGTLGGTGCQTSDISDHAQVVGHSYTASWEDHAFVWDSVNGMVDLNTLLPEGSQWTLNYAVGVNDTGDIVGSDWHGPREVAYLARVRYVLTTSVQGQGWVEPSGGEYVFGEPVLVEAVAAGGWRFHHWEGSLSGSQNPVELVMNGDKSVTAVFVRVYTLTMGVSGQGSVDPPVGQHPYAEGTPVTVMATPAGGWAFDHWEGSLSGSQNPTSVVMTGNKSVTAVFVPLYTLTMGVSGQGSVSPSVGPHVYRQGTQVPVTATPAAGWRFDRWQGSLTGSQNPASVVMTGNKSVTAVFAPVAYTLTTAVQGQGWVEPSGGSYAPGTTLTLKATAGPSWRFDHWEGDLSGSQNPATLTMDGNKSVVVVFVRAGTELMFHYHVSLTGNDEVNDGSYDRPFRTLQQAIDKAHQAASSSGKRATVLAGPGLFESSSPVEVKAGVDLIGQGIGKSVIRTTSATATGYYGVILRPDSSIDGFTILLASTVSQSPAILVSMGNTGTIRLTNCRMDGTQNGVAGLVSEGVRVTGGTSTTFLIADCQFEGLTYGLHAISSGVNVTRNLFKNIARDAVWVESGAAKQSGSGVPLLGDAADLGNTGLNQFRDIGGKFVNNATGTRIQAQGNDWGLYSAGEIAGKVTGADASKFVGKGIGPGTMVVNVVDQRGAVIPGSASPACSIPAACLNGVRDSSTGSFIIEGVAQGEYTVEGCATGYTTNTALAVVLAEHVTPVTVNLAKQGGGGGGGICGAKEARAVYASCMLVIWAAGKTRRRRMRGKSE